MWHVLRSISQAELARSNEQLQLKDTEIQQKDAQIRRQVVELQQKEEQLQQKDVQTRQLTVELQQKDAELNSIQESFQVSSCKIINCMTF